MAYDKIGLEISQDSTANYRKVSKVTTDRKYRASESSDNMSQVLANPESSDPPEQIKCQTDPTFINNDYLIFLFITLKVQDIHYLFSKSTLFTFFAILFFEVPIWSIRFGRPK